MRKQVGCAFFHGQAFVHKREYGIIVNCDFAQHGHGQRRSNPQADATCSYRFEHKDAFVAYGRPGAHLPPFAACKGFDIKAFDPLTQGNVLTQHYAVEKFLLFQPQFVHRPFAVLSNPCAFGQIVGEGLFPQRPELHKHSRVHSRNTPAGIRRHVQEQHGIASDALQPYLHQFRSALRLFGSLPEPAGTYRNIRLGRNPGCAVNIPLPQCVQRRRNGARAESCRIQTAPVGQPGRTPLVAYPAAVGPDVAENYRIRAELPYGFAEKLPVIHLLFAVRSLAASPVEPLLEHGPVTAVVYAPEGTGEFKVILRRSVCRVVAVPGRYVNTEFQAIFAAGVGKLFQHVSLSVTPAAPGNRMAALRIRPQAESVMVLGRNYNAPHSGRLSRTGPLAAIQIRRTEKIFRLAAAAPFSTAESIGTEMAEHIVFHLLPFQLGTSGHRAEWLRRAAYGAGDNQSS